VAEKLTIFDPAEGLTSDEAIAAFMAEAFASEIPACNSEPYTIHLCSRRRIIAWHVLDRASVVSIIARTPFDIPVDSPWPTSPTPAICRRS
jgi:DNA-binding phage protein